MLAATESVQTIADQFLREGWGIIPGVLSADQCGELRAEIDRIFHDVPIDRPDQGYGNPHHRAKMFHYSKIVAQYLDYSPVIDVMEAILSSNCHLIYNNAVLSNKDHAISTWHVDDDDLLFPLGEGIEIDESIPIRCYCVNTQWYLTDVNVEDGPTQVVPFSHRSGRKPDVNGNEAPSYRGHGPKSLIVKAGDVGLQNWQVWHRGAPVRSNKTRYLLQFGYGRRLIAQRFYPFVNYNHAPEWVLKDASERRRRVLGFHPRGPGG